MKKLFSFLIILYSMLGSVSGQGIKISQLPTLPALSNIDSVVFAIVYSGVTYKMPGYYLKGYGSDDSSAYHSLVQIDSFHLMICNLRNECDTIVGVMGAGGGSGPTAWLTAGNASTDETNDYIGTSDNHSLMFRVDNVPFGFLGNGAAFNTNQGIGYNALQGVTGTSNIAFGPNVLRDPTLSGNSNYGFGSHALYSNTTGSGNIAIGSALNFNISGSYNIGIGGANSLVANTTGNYNIAIGVNSLLNITTGIHNTGIGYSTRGTANNIKWGIALGDSASCGSYQFALSDSIHNIKMKGMAKGSGNYALMDTTGTGNIALKLVNVAGSFSSSVSAQTTVTVTIGSTMANNTYKMNVTPTSSIGAVPLYVTNKTTTTFDVVFTSAVTGTLTFDWNLSP